MLPLGHMQTRFGAIPDTKRCGGARNAHRRLLMGLFSASLPRLDDRCAGCRNDTAPRECSPGLVRHAGCRSPFSASWPVRRACTSLPGESPSLTRCPPEAPLQQQATVPGLSSSENSCCGHSFRLGKDICRDQPEYRGQGVGTVHFRIKARSASSQGLRHLFADGGSGDRYRQRYSRRPTRI